MAFAVRRDSISNELALQINSLLTLIPEKTYNNFNKFSDNQDVKIITFYHIINGILHLPFLFASSLLQVIPNINISYPLTSLIFTGKLRDYQISVEEKAWEQLETYGTTTLGLYPGFGKTILGAKLASRSKLLTVILVTREILTIQWKKTFTDNTTAKVWIVGRKILQNYVM